MKNIITLFLISILFIGCASIKTGYSNSADTITGKEFQVLGNLRVEVSFEDYKYDKLMNAAIEKFGDGVDIINIKADFPVKFTIRDKTIFNFLVIRFN